MTRTKKWDEMSWYEMVLARQVPEPEWYPSGSFCACWLVLRRGPKQNRSNICLACRQADKKKVMQEDTIKKKKKNGPFFLLSKRH